MRIGDVRTPSPHSQTKENMQKLIQIISVTPENRQDGVGTLPEKERAARKVNLRTFCAVLNIKHLLPLYTNEHTNAQ